MRSDIKKTLLEHYALSFPMDQPDYYITPEYRHYRETLARFNRNTDQLEDLDRVIRAAFPKLPLEHNINLVDNPGIQIFYKPQGLGDVFGPSSLEPGEKEYSFIIHISALGPFWHMQVDSTECNDEEECVDYLESIIPPIFAKGHKQLSKSLKELGYRELDCTEAWESVKDFTHHLISAEFVRIGHLLFDIHSSFGVANFEETMLGLDGLFDEMMDNLPFSGLDEPDEEPWIEDKDNGLFYEPPPDEPEKPQTLH